MEIYLMATIIFLVIFCIRIIISCWMSYRRGEKTCPWSKSTITDENDSIDEYQRRRSSNSVYVIDLDCRNTEPPSYEETVTDQQPPPAYEVAVKMLPILPQPSGL